ncbi:hypothetical protein ACFV4P_16350 [Kitasatospora sp. NPDC059795]|uniref:hypothetical protein n=1 Tax=unclassified Kitasatospora TaxID=2633591 RepID=UPI00093C659F|nr:hypothetical protein [Kitasatospora sp. CB01950]OKJ17077.1 hypothetical protein AMK19_02895 [Kitasatospora sp. CB01950]
MKSKLGKAVVTTLAALALTGIGAPAYAHVVAGGGGQLVATAHEPFLAGGGGGFAGTDHIFTLAGGGGWATSTALGGGGGGVAAIG